MTLDVDLESTPDRGRADRRRRRCSRSTLTAADSPAPAPRPSCVDRAGSLQAIQQIDGLPADALGLPTTDALLGRRRPPRPPDRPAGVGRSAGTIAEGTGQRRRPPRSSSACVDGEERRSIETDLVEVLNATEVTGGSEVVLDGDLRTTGHHGLRPRRRRRAPRPHPQHGHRRRARGPARRRGGAGGRGGRDHELRGHDDTHRLTSSRSRRRGGGRGVAAAAPVVGVTLARSVPSTTTTLAPAIGAGRRGGQRGAGRCRARRWRRRPRRPPPRTRARSRRSWWPRRLGVGVGAVGVGDCSRPPQVHRCRCSAAPAMPGVVQHDGGHLARRPGGDASCSWCRRRSSAPSDESPESDERDPWSLGFVVTASDVSSPSRRRKSPITHGDHHEGGAAGRVDGRFGGSASGHRSRLPYRPSSWLIGRPSTRARRRRSRRRRRRRMRSGS